MKTTLFWKYSALALVVIAFGACSVDNNSSSVETETLNDESLTERFSINVETDPGVLASRIINRNETVGAKIKRDGTVILDTTGVVVESQILPPNSPQADVSDLMSATHITYDDDKYYVTYHSNNTGDFEGGLQVFDIESESFTNISEATTGDFEWNHAYVGDDDLIWVAGDANRGASLFAIDADGNGNGIADTDSASVVKLFGPSANATIGIGGDIYVSVGGANDADTVLNDGRGQVGVYKLNADVTNADFADEEAGLEIDQRSRIKHLAIDNGILVALRINGSGDAELVRYGASIENDPISTETLSGAALIDASITPVDGKNGLYVASNTVAYIAAGDAGVISVNPSNGNVIDQIDFNADDELGSVVNAVWGDANYLYVSASSAFVIIPIDTGGDILEEQAKRIPLSYLVGDVNGDNVKNVDDIEAAQANVNYAYPISSNNNNAEVLVAIGRAGVVYLSIDM